MKFSFGESTALIRRILRPVWTSMGACENLVALRLRLPGQDIRRVQPHQHPVVALGHGAVRQRSGLHFKRIADGALRHGVLQRRLRFLAAQVACFERFAAVVAQDERRNQVP